MSERHPSAYPDARPTRYKGLGYMKLAPSNWRLVDLEQTAYNNRCSSPNMNTPSCVGPIYKTKAELLADLHRFATDFGAEAA